MINSPSRPADRRVQTVCLLILTLIGTAWALEQLQPVLVPFVLAIFFSQCLTPLIDYLMRRFRWPQGVAVSAAAVIGIAVVAGVGFLLASSVSGMSQSQLDEYSSRFKNFTNQLQNSSSAHWFGLRPGDSFNQILGQVQAKGYDLFTFVSALIYTILKNTATVLILMAFLLFGRRRSPEQSHGILGEIEIRIQRYISLTVAISILTGLLVGASLSILGVQFAAAFGFLAFLLNFIPNLGAVVATILPLPIAFLDPHLSIVAKVLALAIPTGIQIAIGSFVQPRMMGHSLELHPVVLLLSLLFFTMIWGLGGAFLATPLTAVIKIVFEKIPATRPLAAVLAGNLDPLAETIDTPPEPPPKSADQWEAEKVLTGGDEFR
jgi:AI-2 transport protein TqsA